MSLLNQASLIQIPSGYKDGTLYSAKPINGDGDFTFSRGSNLAATRVNSEGLIEKGRENLLLQSNTFDTTWAAVGINITSGQSGYDGTNDAWKIESTNTGQSRIAQTISISGVNTVSFYAKAGTANYIIPYIIGSGDPRVFFNLSAGVVETTAFNIDASIEDVGSGWYRCSMTLERTSSSLWVFIGNTDNNFNSAIGDSIYIQDAQLQVGLVSTDVITTTTTTAQAGILEDMPRLDYSGGASCGSLILEPQRTNLITQSEYIDSWTKTNSPTITTNIAIAPDGTNSAGGIQDTTGGTFKRIRQSTSVSANSTNTASVFVKKETIQTNFGGLALTYTGSTAKFAYAIINPVDGTIVVSSDSVIGATSTKAEDYGNWWRFSLTATDNGGNTNLEIAYYATISTNGTSTGVGIGSVRTIWGFQLEIGASYPTSYMPTYGSSVTRSADSNIVVTSANSIIGQQEGTFYLEIDNALNTPNAFYYNISDSSYTNWIFCGYDGHNFRFYVRTGNSVQYDSGLTGVIGTNKIVFIYKSGAIAAFVNGIKVKDSTTTFNVTASLNYVTLGSPSPAGGSVLEAYPIKQALLFPTALTDAECIELTTI